MAPMATDQSSPAFESQAAPSASLDQHSMKPVVSGPAKSPGVLSSRLDGSLNGYHTEETTGKPPSVPNLMRTLDLGLLQRLYSDSVEAKIWATAVKGLNQVSPPRYFPEYTRPGGDDYIYRDLEFWTSGFFPGSMYLLLERRTLYPTMSTAAGEVRPHLLQVKNACTWWTENLHGNATLRGTHDLGFMIMPWASRAWKLNNDSRALETIKTTAQTLLDRYDAKIGCIRSWDQCITRKYDFRDPSADYLVIIDNMMNLDLLFFAAQELNDDGMREAAIQHARKTAQTHVRADSSTTHLIVFDPNTGAIKDRLTNQGFSHTSCWARGQAWAIAGFAETYQWTQMDEFLETASACADYFLRRLPPSGVAPWDFDAYAQNNTSAGANVNGNGGAAHEPPDTSATMIAAYGMLLIHKAVVARGQPSPYLGAALTMAHAVASRHLNESARYEARQQPVAETVEHGVISIGQEVQAVAGRGDTILNGATINNYEHAPRRWVDHGLVYADYYFLLFGNELLKMDLGNLLCIR